MISNGQIEDVLYLAVEDRPPPLTGQLKLDMKVALPPGNDDELERLRLDGSFEVATARFTSADLQAKTVELSRKAVGKAKTPPNDVASNLRGTFVLRGGVIRFSNVNFSVPGAHVNVAGTYALRSEALDFRGTLRLDAKLSELTTGAESFFLKLFDPLVRRKEFP